MGNVLVTGGAGFIGAHVTDALAARGHRITVLDDLSGGVAENVTPEADFVHGSINDVFLVNELFSRTHFDYVFHLAAYAAEGLSHFVKRFNYSNNLIGSVTLINAAINSNVKCFVFTSSIAVYGASPELPMTEDTRPHPNDPYGIAKLAVEQELVASRDMFGLDYGIFMNQILQDKPLSVFGDGEQTRAFSYIGDVAPIIAESVDRPAAINQVFNIGADQVCTINGLARAVADAMGVRPDVSYVPARHEVEHAYSSHEKVRRVFGERPMTPLGEGLARMAAWVRQHGARESRAFECIEVMKNFPTAWLTSAPGRQRE
jgi:UDP-glucose 4-epimerase